MITQIDYDIKIVYFNNFQYQILIMLGFQAFGKGIMRMACRTSFPKMSTYIPKHINWSF